MKNHLDNLMKQHNASALWISGAAQHNPAMVYLTGGAHLTGADLFYLPGQTPILCHGPMEREEAAKSGFKLISYANYDSKALLEQAGGDQSLAVALRYKQILTDIGLTTGKVVLYGNREFGPFFAILKKLEELIPELELTGDVDDAILMEARSTKDEPELERIRGMALTTTRVVGNTLDYLVGHRVKSDTLVKPDDTPLTIGDVKAKINLWLAEYGAENPEDTIFAIGHDAGVPHSSGTLSDPIQLGKTIVFDIFPCEKGGGYFYDFTRTWCLGYATEDVQLAYEQVWEVYQTILKELTIGENPYIYQQRTCELFEGMGHETVRTDLRITQGYVHGLGHGVGLDVHEKPWFSKPKDPSNRLQIGSVFTIEPGLYYPEKGFGIRLEDTYYVSADEKFRRFADFPYDLVIPMGEN